MRFLFHTTFKKDKHSILAVILLGSLSHFLYELSGGAAIFALFCPINESVWEHLKLLFFPFLFITAIQWYRQKPSLLPFFYHRFLEMCIRDSPDPESWENAAVVLFA